MKKIYSWFIIREWLLLPYSIYEALTCDKPYKIVMLMDKVPDQNKVLTYRIIMRILELRAKRS